MTAQFHYTTLAQQTQAVQCIADVFNDVRFVAPTNAQNNPGMVVFAKLPKINIPTPAGK